MPSNADIVRNVYSAFSRGDVPAVLGALAPDVLWTEAEGSPYGGTYSGSEAVLQNVFARLAADWDVFSVTPSEYVSERNMVVALGTCGGTHKATGKKFSAAFAHVWRVEGGKVARFREHTDTALMRGATQ